MPNLTYNDTITMAGLPDVIRTYFSAQLQYTAAPMMVFDQFSETKTEHRTDKAETVTWTIFRQMAPTIGALSETADVNTQQIQDFRVSFAVTEYGNAVGTTEKLDRLSFVGPVMDIVKTLLAPQMAFSLDRVARNVAWAGAPTRYAGGRANRASLVASDIATIDLVKQSAHSLRMNRVRPDNGGYVCVVHPSVLYDLREEPLWEDVGKYSDPARIASGEVGRLFGVRFVESSDARLPNAGAITASDAQSTLTGSHAFNSSILTVASTSNWNVGDELTLFDAAQSTPDGTGVNEENVVIKSVDSGTQATLERATAIAHANGDKVRKALDVFPMMFLGADRPYAKSTVVNPEVRIALKIDKLQRMSYIGWYALQGHGVIRNWTYLVVEAAASQNSAYIFGF